MQKILRISVLVASLSPLAVLAGCNGVLGGVDVTVTAWQGDLVATPGAPGGSAAALSQGGMTEASIQITGGPGAADSYGWRIRRGSCSSPGDVIGGDAQYPVLEHGAGTTTVADALLTDPMPPGSNYHVVLRRLSDGVEVACGQLERV